MPTTLTPGIKNPQKNTQGGFNTASIYSGQVAPVITSCPGAVAFGSDVLLFSGAGRLDLVMFTNLIASGQPTFFYDAAPPLSSGGPFSLSGHKILAVINQPGTTFISPIASGQNLFVNFPPPGLPQLIQMPFQSGLCVNSRSGQAGFTAGWTPEAANQ